MKRAAEMQLTRDIADIEQDDQEDFRPFSQADEATLATRNIRSLPRRRGIGGQSTSTSGSQSPVPSGFGPKQIKPSSTTENLASISTTAPAVTPFAFGKPHSAGPVPNFSFKLPSSSTAPPTTLSTSSQAPPSPVSSNPIQGHKSRASFSQPSTSSPLKKEITTGVGGTPTSNFASPPTSNMPASDAKLKPTFSFSTSGSNTAMNGTRFSLGEIRASQDEVDYWKGLRGLNISFLTTARSLFEEEVFADLSELFAGYCKIRNELNESRRAVQDVSDPFPAANSTVTGGGFSFAGKSVSLSSLVPPTSTTTLTTGAEGFPALTTGLSFGGKTLSFTSDSGSSAAAATAGSSQSTSIDVDELENDKGDERMGEEFKEAESQQPSVSKFGVATKEMKEGGSGFSFGALPGAKPSSSFGGFGAASGISDFKGFGFGVPQSTVTGATKQLFSFGLPPPGTTRPPEKTQESSASTAPKPAFSFGRQPPSSTTAPPSDSRPAFGFDLPPPGTTNTPMSMSISMPNEKKPAGAGGFSVGRPGLFPAKNSSDSSTSSGEFKPIGFGGSTLFTGVAGFGFGALPPTPAGGTPGTETPTVQPDGTGGGEDHVPSAEQRYDVEGPGEEDEETVGGLSWRAKVWQLGKARCEDGKEKEGAGVEWIDFGVSFVRLKKHNITGSKRILARHSKTGHIVMNFAFFSALSPKVADKAISFVGVSNGKPTNFKMRLQTAEQAAQLLKTWKALIETE